MRAGGWVSGTYVRLSLVRDADRQTIGHALPYHRRPDKSIHRMWFCMAGTTDRQPQPALLPRFTLSHRTNTALTTASTESGSTWWLVLLPDSHNRSFCCASPCCRRRSTMLRSEVRAAGRCPPWRSKRRCVPLPDATMMVICRRRLVC